MHKPLRLAAFACVGLILLALVLLAPQNPIRADDPVPWEDYGGLDGYYIARGWTEGYSSQPLSATGAQGAPTVLSHTVYLPLVMGSSSAPSVMRETRALWVSRWDFKTARDIEIIVDKAAYANLNVILFQVRGQADALYTPGLEPWSATLSGALGQDPGWDPLATMVEEAHNRGIEVHAWINVYPAWLGPNPPPDSAWPQPMYHTFNTAYGDDWVLWRQDGTPTRLNPSYLWGSPGNPYVASHIVAVCADIVDRYDVDGLHFDYIRYDDQGRPYSFDPASEAAYTAARAADPSLSYEDWQRAQIAGFLQRVRQEALAGRPKVRLTTSAWPIYDKTPYHWYPAWGTDGYHDIYQDSVGWAQNGLVDGIMPMLYTQSIHAYRDRFDELIVDFASSGQPGAVFAGIAGDYYTYAVDSWKPAYADPFAEIAWRIEASRAAGARGQALFSYRLFDHPCPPGQPNCGLNYWALLRNGPYQQTAVPNWP